MLNTNRTVSIEKTTTFHIGKPKEPRDKVFIRLDSPKWLIRYAYYAFVFSLPFETTDIGTAATLPRFIAISLVGLALFQPRLCYSFPPRAFWWFALYLFGYILHGSYLVFAHERVPGFAGSIIFPLFTLIQLLFFFWISYNLMKHERVVKGALWAFAAGSMVLAALQALGITTMVEGERVTAFEANPNTIATVLSVGLLALVGLAFGREKRDWKAVLFFFLGCGIVAIAIIQTGSRGAVVGLVGSLSFFFLKGKSLATKLKLGLIALVGIVLLGFASYQIDTVRVRWERTVYEGDLSGRENIFAAALEMILEKPLLGWGPAYHTWELGSRLGELARDEHNLYLRLLAEGGIVGAFPFLVGLWLCWRAAWKARHSVQGILPAIMLLFILIINLKGSGYMLKFFWVVLSYALASSSVAVPVSERAAAALSQHSLRRRAQRLVLSRQRPSPGVARGKITSTPS